LATATRNGDIEDLDIASIGTESTNFKLIFAVGVYSFQTLCDISQS
jgi:hypothetical protein